MKKIARPRGRGEVEADRRHRITNSRRSHDIGVATCAKGQERRFRTIPPMSPIAQQRKSELLYRVDVECLSKNRELVRRIGRYTRAYQIFPRSGFHRECTKGQRRKVAVSKKAHYDLTAGARYGAVRKS